MWDHQARQVHLVDLGMTSDIDPQTKKLQFPEDENHLIGTFSVMSPEQAKCKNDLVGTQTEFFNLGATLYTLLAGRPPYQGDNKFELMINAQDLYHPALSKTISKSMRQFIQGLMHRRIKKRPSSAQEILDQIKKLQWK